MDDCWNHIGIAGDGSCAELPRVVHCRNCEVYARAGRGLLERTPPAGYLEQWALQLAAPPRQEDADTLSAVLFRIASERFALPTAAFAEAVEVRPVHRIPHRSGPLLLGFVNIRGELQLCVSLAALLHVERAAERQPARPRLAVVERNGARWVFPVDELMGVHHVPRRALAAPPATDVHDAAALTEALFDHAGQRVAPLDAQLLFERLRRAIG